MHRPLRFVHLFPELLNLYADQGNLAVLSARARQRGIDTEIVPVKMGTDLDLQDADLVLLGGGSDREQAIVGRELLRYRQELLFAVEHGLPLLAVCGGYQLLGEYYELSDGERIPGLHLVDLVTRAGKERLIGNIAIRWQSGGDHLPQNTIVGFENHGGRTLHEYPPLGTVIKGYGNNGKDNQEGIQYKGIVGTYIHGPLLPKNPHVADELIKKALQYRGLDLSLQPLADDLEWQAHNAMLRRMNIEASTPARTISDRG